MGKGFNDIHDEKQARHTKREPFFKIANGEYEYVENISFQNSKNECLALPYGYFVSAMLAENTLHIMFNNWEVFLEGRNLKPIYNAILDRTLKAIRKAEDGEIDSAELPCYISHLQIKSNDMDNALGQSAKDQLEAEADIAQDSSKEEK